LPNPTSSNEISGKKGLPEELGAADSEDMSLLWGTPLRFYFLIHFLNRLQLAEKDSTKQRIGMKGTKTTTSFGFGTEPYFLGKSNKKARLTTIKAILAKKLIFNKCILQSTQKRMSFYRLCDI